MEHPAEAPVDSPVEPPPYQPTNQQTNQPGGDPVFSAEKTPARRATPGKTAYHLWKHVLDVLDRKGFPAPDEKLKEIVGAQIKHLLKAGYPFERVRHFAVELALSWDNSLGHQRLLGLRQAVLQDDADREYRAHEQRTRDLSGPPQDPDTRAALLAGISKAKEAMRAPVLQTRCRNCGWLRDEQSCQRCLYLAHRGIA